jgi:hypothetical protein
MKDITNLLAKLTDSMLSEDSLKQIGDVINENTNQAVNLALENQDAEYSNKLVKIIEAIDNDYTRKMSYLFERVDKEHTGKLRNVVKRHNKIVTNESKKFFDNLVDSLDSLVELTLENLIPTKSIQEAVNNKRAFEVLNSLRSTLAVDQALATKSIREGVLDGQHQLQKAQNQARLAEKRALIAESKMNMLATKSFISEKTKGMDSNKQTYLHKYFKDKPLEFVKENFDLSARMFDSRIASENQRLRDEASQESFSSKHIKDTDTRVINEKKDNRPNPNDGDNVNPMVQMYAEALKQYK